MKNLSKDYVSVQKEMCKASQESNSSLETKVGRRLLEKYALLFGRNKTKPGTDQVGRFSKLNN